MQTVTLLANAKINLFLDIDSRRADGYHNIISLMQSVSLCDEVSVSYEPCAEKLIEITVSDARIPTDSKNIAYRAADRLIDSGRVKIDIVKNIPSPAGLAGGSADAAAVIFALRSFGCVNKSEAEIISIASSIGADVPFCLVGGTKKILGIGDIIEDIPAIERTSLVIAIDGEGVSTPAAYGMLDEKYDNFSDYTPHTYNFAAPAFFDCFNIFEEVILPKRERANALRSEMYSLGANVAFMSGSGPSIVGVFGSDMSAENAARVLREKGIFACACHTADVGIKKK